MILIEFLFAPTVPSAPRPQNLQLIVPSGVVTSGLPASRERLVTSSVMPIVNFFLVLLLNTATIWLGVVSFDPKP